MLSDARDADGCMGQALSPRVRSLDEGLRLWGRARTERHAEVDNVEAGENPNELEIAIVDDLRPRDVAVFACGVSSNVASWGRFLSAATCARGAPAYLRDVWARHGAH